MTECTKMNLGNALKECCRHKSFSKISISDITSTCHLNRQTFYYHFEDKYELLEWVYYEDGFKDLQKNISFENWHFHMEKLLETMLEDRIFYENTISSYPVSFQKGLFEILCSLFQQAICSLDGRNKLNQQEIQYYSRFYSYGMCGLIMDWVNGGMKTSPHVVSMKIRKLADDSEKMAHERIME